MYTIFNARGGRVRGVVKIEDCVDIVINLSFKNVHWKMDWRYSDLFILLVEFQILYSTLVEVKLLASHMM